MSRKKHARKQNESKASGGLVRLLLLTLALGVLVGTLAYVRSGNSAGELVRIRELGRHDPAAAIKRLEAHGDRSREVLLLRCQLLAAAGRWEQAEETFAAIEAPELCGQQELIGLAGQALESGIYSLADQVLDASYRQGHHDPRLLRTMIDVKHQLGADPQALPLCDEMSKLAPRDPYPWLLSARIYHRAEKIDLAIAAYREALLRDPDARDARLARFQIADLAIYAGDLAAAGEQLDQLSVESPNDADVDVLRAKLLHRQGNPDASLRVLDGVLASRPDMVSALLERGVLQLERENFAEASGDLKQVVTLAPENYTGHYKLGLAYQRLNQPELARQHLERSGEITNRIAAQKLQAEERRHATDPGATK
ncbi:MAG: tetratricopeptide repeat protein [Planctomycetota bacterium]